MIGEIYEIEYFGGPFDGLIKNVPTGIDGMPAMKSLIRDQSGVHPYGANPREKTMFPIEDLSKLRDFEAMIRDRSPLPSRAKTPLPFVVSSIQDAIKDYLRKRGFILNDYVDVRYNWHSEGLETEVIQDTLDGEKVLHAIDFSAEDLYTDDRIQRVIDDVSNSVQATTE